VKGERQWQNIEYFDNKMKTERVAVQARAATGNGLAISDFAARVVAAANADGKLVDLVPEGDFL
jgi:uncharacterized protein YraI